MNYKLSFLSIAAPFLIFCEENSSDVLAMRPFKKTPCASYSSSELTQVEQKNIETSTPPLEEKGSPFVDLSFIIWQSKMWGFEFGAKSLEATAETTSSIVLDEKVSVPDFAWRPGFKLELGYQFAFDGWDIDSRWTWYRGETTHLKKHIDLEIEPQGQGVIPLWFYPFYTVEAPSEIRFFEAVSSWRHYFNSIDLELGRISLLSSKAKLHLFTGLKGAWLHEYYRVEYDDGSTIQAILPGTDELLSYALLKSAITFNNETWGGGPRVGFDSSWNMGLGISVIVNSAFSLLYSATKTHRDQNDLNQNTESEELVPFHLDLKTHSHQLKSVAEAQIGADWRYDFGKTSQVGLTIAYEIQYFWGQNNLRRGYSHVQPGGMFPSRGDLQMHGLTATAAYRY